MTESMWSKPTDGERAVVYDSIAEHLRKLMANRDIRAPAGDLSSSGAMAIVMEEMARAIKLKWEAEGSAGGP